MGKKHGGSNMPPERGPRRGGPRRLMSVLGVPAAASPLSLSSVVQEEDTAALDIMVVLVVLLVVVQLVKKGGMGGRISMEESRSSSIMGSRKAAWRGAGDCRRTGHVGA
jgi:hypothetical protein